MSELRVVAREAFFIKKSDITKQQARDLISESTHHFFEEKACQTCEFLPDRKASESKLSHQCPNCAAYKGGVVLTKEVQVGKNLYVSVPGGNKRLLTEVLKDYEFSFVSKRPTIPFKRSIRFTGELTPTQVEAVEAIKRRKYGVIKAPPRTGKTVSGVALSCQLGLKTIILAAQKEWLDGFYETYLGSETQKPLTNARPAQIGFPRTFADFEKLDVCLVTYQKFRSPKGQKLLRRIRSMFSVMIVDEVHMGAASNFASVISKFNVRYRCGLSGTPSRKDMRYIIVDELIGPIVYDAKVKRLRPTIKLTKTPYRKAYKGRVLWPTMVRSLESNKARQKLIAQMAIKDVEDDHMILIPYLQIKPLKMLVRLINQLAGRRIAHEFHGSVPKMKRKQLIQDARKYKVKILVGNSKLVSVGINIPRASMLYETVLSSNAENCEQRISRVLTKCEGQGKPPPAVRMFLDDMNVRKRCMANEFWSTINPKFRPIISDRDLIALKSYLSQKDKGVPSWEL